MRLPLFLLISLAAACRVPEPNAEPRREPERTPPRFDPPNIPLPTLGGKQLWADLYTYAGWRIQENVQTGHHRLLDPRQIRRAWGSYETCLAAFETSRQEKAIGVRSRHHVILVHGLFRSAASMGRLAEALGKAGYEAVSISYPSTRRSLPEHAGRLTRLLESLEEADRVSFVTHSLGGLVVREALSRRAPWMDRIRVHRLLMIAPPSRGSALADRLASFPLFDLIAGPSVEETTTGRAAGIAPPACPFGIIAGGRGNDRGWNPLVPGDDDGVVAVAETRLEGAEDFLLVKAEHTFIMNRPEVIAAAISYLRTGKFRRE